MALYGNFAIQTDLLPNGWFVVIDLSKTELAERMEEIINIEILELDVPLHLKK